MKERPMHEIRTAEPAGYAEFLAELLGDHPKAAIDDQVKTGHREKA
jgi:hypothetical protein